jgi:para-aminobenzoate synthetase / 4-amino-4-deoxychorismate lyase
MAVEEIRDGRVQPLAIRALDQKNGGILQRALQTLGLPGIEKRLLGICIIWYSFLHSQILMNRTAEIRSDLARISELAAQPGFVLLRDGAGWQAYVQPSEVLTASDARSLEQVLARIEQHIQDGGEAAGYLHYEAGYALEPRLNRLLASYSGPLCWFGLYERASSLDSIPAWASEQGDLIHDFEWFVSRDDYYERLERIRRLIEDGEVYQINFTTRLLLQPRATPWEMFKILFRRHPVPHAAFVNTGSEQIISLSPEMFFEIEEARITVKPMKGTAARGRTLQEDLLAAEQLRNSAKDRAENVMIVDLMRNDLGRICRTGSVKTTSLFEVERYPSLWQMTSTVEGELRENYTVESVLWALFPSGSVTGAPKIRAMEHIAHLEGSARRVYTGAIGFFARGNARFNVAIRTVELNHEQATMGIGSGVVYDSDPDSEWAECQAKAGFLLRSEPEFEIIETLYWKDKYRLLDEHIARMRDSAQYFGFTFEEHRLRAELRELEGSFPAEPHRVRVLLSREGEIQISHADFHPKRFGKVAISQQRISSHNRFLFHKTTNREMYILELAAARERGLDDVLFLNEKGELTEGTIHNVFVVKDGVWRTPQVTCGLLPGILRSEILRTQANSCEAILYIHDLENADAIYLCNSVQGLFQVNIAWDATGDDAIAKGEETVNLVSMDRGVTRI